jgi:signal transduction histidine kinase
VVLGLGALLGVVSAAATYALLRLAAASRESRRRRHDAGMPAALLSAALQDAVSRLKAHADVTSARADASERMAGRIVEHLTAGLLVVGADGTVAILNPAGRRMLAVTRDPVGTAMTALLADAQPLLGVVDECLQSQEPLTRRSVAILTAGGRTVHLGVTVSPLGDPSKPGGAICLFSDLTAVVALEEQVRLKDTLAQLGELTAGIAHEFRNGLATIKGYARLMEPHQLPESYRPYLLAIRDETEALGRIVTNFLNFARPERVAFGEVGLAELAADAVHELQRELPQAELRVVGSFGRVEGDEVLLRQVLVNLIRNGVQACEGAGLKPVLSVEGELSVEGDVCRVRVDDAGPGVAPAMRDRVFRPFFTTRSSGTGLGLAIVQKVVVTHNGRIEIGASPLGGARFEITLPVLRRAA